MATSSERISTWTRFWAAPSPSPFPSLSSVAAAVAAEAAAAAAADDEDSDESDEPPTPRPDIDTSLLAPLVAHRASYNDAYVGRVAECPRRRQCLLVVMWQSTAAYEAFEAEPEGGRRLWANLAAAAADEGEEGAEGKEEPEPVLTRKVDFGKIAFWR